MSDFSAGLQTVGLCNTGLSELHPAQTLDGLYEAKAELTAISTPTWATQ